MRDYLQDYVSEIDEKIKNKDIDEETINNHLIKIKFFQHERLIHLLVTLFYGMFLFVSVIIFLSIPLFVIVVYIVLIILIFYVRHYFFLENRVQYLYKQYDKMKEINKAHH
jgi:ABC-type bacteriocin/lantibiotic exporter with double-glycine peptidase domain